MKKAARGDFWLMVSRTISIILPHSPTGFSRAGTGATILQERELIIYHTVSYFSWPRMMYVCGGGSEFLRERVFREAEQGAFGSLAYCRDTFYGQAREGCGGITGGMKGVTG